MNTQVNASAGSQKSENKKNHNITKQDVTCPWISVITVTQINYTCEKENFLIDSLLKIMLCIFFREHA